MSNIVHQELKRLTLVDGISNHQSIVSIFIDHIASLVVTQHHCSMLSVDCRYVAYAKFFIFKFFRLLLLPLREGDEREHNRIAIAGLAWQKV